MGWIRQPGTGAQGAFRLVRDAAWAWAGQPNGLAALRLPPEERSARVTYRIDPDSTGSWLVTQVESGRRTSYGGSREWVEASLQREQEGEDRMREALASGDPVEACRLGWHSGVVPVSPRPTWFRWAAGRVGPLLVFRIANTPFEWAAITVWCHGPNANPWHCDTCALEIPEP